MIETPRTTRRRWEKTPEAREQDRVRLRALNRDLREAVGATPKGWQPWTHAEMQFVEEFADQPIVEVARALGRSYNAVARVRREIGVARQNATYRRESELAQ